MYQTHAVAIQQEALWDIRIPKATVVFASQTIQFPLVKVGKAIDSIGELYYNSPMLNNAMKKSTFKWAERQKALPMTWLREQSLPAQIDYFRTIPGIGCAKAGFLCQLLLGTGGCLDIHNLRKFNLKPTQSTDKYCENLVKVGLTTEQLWDDWCQYVYVRDGRFTSPNHVSFVHYQFITKAKELF